MTDDNVELKPCPFCGGEAKKLEALKGYKVECENRDGNCPVNMRTRYHPNFSAAVDQWNTRAAMPQQEVTVKDAAAKLSPDQLIEALAIRLSETDPDVAPWAVQWCDKVADAITTSPPTPKDISAALRAISEGE